MRSEQDTYWRNNPGRQIRVLPQCRLIYPVFPLPTRDDRARGEPDDGLMIDVAGAGVHALPRTQGLGEDPLSRGVGFFLDKDDVILWRGVSKG